MVARHGLGFGFGFGIHSEGAWWMWKKDWKWSTGAGRDGERRIGCKDEMGGSSGVLKQLLGAERKQGKDGVTEKRRNMAWILHQIPFWGGMFSGI